MDLTAEFYLQTVDRVFVRHQVPLGLLRRRQLIDLKAISRGAARRGEKDDIRRQRTRNALDLAPTFLPGSAVKGVGHYGVFNGSRCDDRAAHSRLRDGHGESRRRRTARPHLAWSAE
jgi:poly(3-hydroxybutyrate) depolymerase